jgi:transcriptional regulator with XRE-family HTH domain
MPTAMRLTVAPLVTLRQARERRALSLSELAREAGLAVGTVLRIEHQATTPQPRVRRALAAALRCDVQQIHWPCKDDKEDKETAHA